MVMGSEPSFMTMRRMPSAASVVRSTRSFSTGGTPAGRSRSAGRKARIAAISAARSTTGTSARMTRLRVTAHLRGFEHPHPAQFGELALVRVEHELARVAEARLHDRAFPLAEHHGVGRFRAAQARAGAIDVKEHP